MKPICDGNWIYLALFAQVKEVNINTVLKQMLRCPQQYQVLSKLEDSSAVSRNLASCIFS